MDTNCPFSSRKSLSASLLACRVPCHSKQATFSLLHQVYTASQVMCRATTSFRFAVMARNNTLSNATSEKPLHGNQKFPHKDIRLPAQYYNTETQSKGHAAASAGLRSREVRQSGHPVFC